MLELTRSMAIRYRGNCFIMAWSRRWAATALGCSGCHENEAVAPLTAGTWTRINDIRLALPQFADYSLRQFLVESIVAADGLCHAGLCRDDARVLWRQLTPQQLADLVAFLDSQDQLLPGE